MLLSLSVSFDAVANPMRRFPDPAEPPRKERRPATRIEGKEVGADPTPRLEKAAGTIAALFRSASKTARLPLSGYQRLDWFYEWVVRSIANGGSQSRHAQDPSFERCLPPFRQAQRWVEVIPEHTVTNAARQY